MIFTIGHKESYDQYLREQPEGAQKKGKGTHDGAAYQGGSVWETEAGARGYLENRLPDRSKGYDVYGLDADWDVDAYQIPGEPFRRLLRDAKIISLRA